MSYLRLLGLFAHSGVQHILRCVFGSFFFVLCTLCCQFLWIVHFLLVFSNVYYATSNTRTEFNRSDNYQESK
jgi:hypothetical protein